MSVFKVKLNNIDQGLLDKDPSTMTADYLGDQFSVSLQRSVYVMGPNKINRLLKDGEQFTDCNYWKRFAYPNVPLNEAFIEVVTDDGSVYSDVAAENTYPVTWNPGAASDGIIVAGDTFTDTNMALDILTTYGGPAVFVQLQNLDSSNPVQVRLNGSTGAVFTLEAESTQIFNNGDLSVSKIEFDNSASGASNVNRVQVVLSVRSLCTS